MLNELLKSRHHRLKIWCLVLIMYTMFNCNGLIWLTSIHLDFSNEDHINFFSDEGFAGFGISCVFALISTVLLWFFSIRVLLQYYYKEKDMKWMNTTKWIAKIGGIFWILAMLSWTITVLFAEIDNWLFTLALALVPSWNKSLCIGILYCIFHEFKPTISRTQRVVRWINIVTIFLSCYVFVLTIICGILWLWWIFSWFSGAFYVFAASFNLFIVSIALTPFYNFFFTLYDQLSPTFNYRYYMICVPCCCGCFCRDDWCRGCVPRCCLNRNDIKISTWLIIGMSFVWLVCTIFENNNECLAENSLIEYAFGFRGAAILVLLFSVFINIELTYAGTVKERHARAVVVNQNNIQQQQPGQTPAQQIGVNLTVDGRNGPGNDGGANDGNPDEQEVEVR